MEFQQIKDVNLTNMSMAEWAVSDGMQLQNKIYVLQWGRKKLLVCLSLGQTPPTSQKGRQQEKII